MKEEIKIGDVVRLYKKGRGKIRAPNSLRYKVTSIIQKNGKPYLVVVIMPPVRKPYKRRFYARGMELVPNKKGKRKY